MSLSDFDPDFGALQLARDLIVQVGDVRADENFQRGDLLALAVEEDGVGLADLERHDEDAPGRADDRIDDFRVRDDNIARVDIELDDRGLVERERYALRRAARCGGEAG